ncbi:MAG: hypothetical protein WAT43_17795, partial [Chitinophagales bacterium]
MKRMLLLNIYVFLLIPFASFSQSPDIQWEKKLIAAEEDFGVAAFPTPDGGTLLGATSNSGISGSKTIPSLGEYDIWIIKLDALNNIEWQKAIGGSGSDFLISMKQTSDGNFILAAWSDSGIGPMKSDYCRGSRDYWLVKIDVDGNIIWENTFGSNYTDEIQDVNETMDGGFIIAGYSEGDISGEKTEGQFEWGSYGAWDYWIIKTDAAGNLEWDNTIGGNNGDRCYAAIETSDGNFIVGGVSYALISGDKTINPLGLNDIWILKLSSTGTIIWQKSIGGSGTETCRSIIELNDGNYLINSDSNSNISGEKTENSRGLTDFWIFKIDDSGNILAQKTMGGSAADQPFSVIESSDGNMLVTGYSRSGVSAEKTEPVIGGQDIWSIKFNFDDDILWDKTIGFLNDDYMGQIFQTNDGGYLLSGSTGINTSGQAYYVKLAADACIAIPEICNAIDDNCNGLIDDDVTETISITALGATEFCQGNSVVLNATYTGTAVQWKKNGGNIPGATLASFTATTKGNYSCITTSVCGTVESTPIFVNVIKNPNSSISAGGPTTFCAGGSVILTEVAVAGCTYQWYKGASPIPGATSLTYT